MKLLFITCITFSLLGSVLAQQEVNSKTTLDIFHEISSENIFGYSKDLSHPKYKGRLSGTPEYMEATTYITDHLKNWGIKPGGENGSWFQMMSRSYCDVLSTGALSVEIKNKENQSFKKEYKFTDHYFPGSNSANGTIEAEVVYVGYGITAKELNWDDYKKVDVRGKIVMMELGGPYNPDLDGEFEKWKDHTNYASKMENAIQHGAKGMMFIYLKASPGLPYHEELIYCHINTEVAKDLFFNQKKSYEQTLLELKEHKKSVSSELEHIVKISADTKHNKPGEYANVVGILEGSDPILKDEFIILGAHLDGQGSLGEVFVSALDNASGVADIMGVAQALSKLKERPKRSVMFLFFGGEEVGLIGAQHYIDNPLIPKDKTVFMINLDMVGNGRGFHISGLQSWPGIEKHFLNSNEKFIHRKVSTSPKWKAVGRPRSDGALFHRNGYRTLWLHCTDRVKKLYYHHPYDTPETLTPEIMEDVSKLLFLSVLEVANDPNLDVTEKDFTTKGIDE
ncbi:MAG: M28 family peptidase [Bacteroidales bacterium]|nr:M28 family peptidase [Bacteroidales bacterium]